MRAILTQERQSWNGLEVIICIRARGTRRRATRALHASQLHGAQPRRPTPTTDGRAADIPKPAMPSTKRPWRRAGKVELADQKPEIDRMRRNSVAAIDRARFNQVAIAA